MIRAPSSCRASRCYVGHHGWVGARLGGHPDWDEMAELVTDSYRLIAPRRLTARLDDG